ncbi:MAG: hypothetical protein RIQ93_2968, partial [Verrucomicrobiota bacterium]
MNLLHQDVWATPAARLDAWWQLALRHYEVITPVPPTAFRAGAKVPLHPPHSRAPTRSARGREADFISTGQRSDEGASLPLMNDALWFAGLACAVITPLFGQGAAHSGLGRDYGRSMVISRQGIAATSQTLASSAAVQILSRGGSAADAAIAANAVLAVVEPMKNGPGGDLFVLYWQAATKKLTGLNASGPAPRGLTPEFLAKQGITTMPMQGIHSFTVPGVVDGWAKMHQKFGKLPWHDLFTSAIAYAEQGFGVTEAVGESWSQEENVKKVRAFPETARVFLPNGKPPREGEIFRNPDMGRML